MHEKIASGWITNQHCNKFSQYTEKAIIYEKSTYKSAAIYTENWMSNKDVTNTWAKIQ